MREHHLRKTRKSPRKRTVAAGLLAVTAVSPTAASALPAAPEPITVTCAPRTASQYLATSLGSVSWSAPSKSPTPCITFTGYGSSEQNIQVDDEGTLFFEPAFRNGDTGFLRSRDDGASWEFLPTKREDGKPRGRLEPHSYRDPATGRIFLQSSRVDVRHLSAELGFTQSYTDDGGETWKNSKVDLPAIDMLRYTAGKPITSKPVGYPNIMYAMAPTPISTPVGLTTELALTGPTDQQVIRSLDGGDTWTKVGVIPITPKANGCPANEWVLLSGITSDSRGHLYVSGRRCTEIGIAISKDEGVTWSFKAIPKTKVIPFRWILDPVGNPNYVLGEPKVDSADNVYMPYVDEAGKVRLTISRDHGVTWSNPIVINDPSVTKASFASLDVREPGKIGIGYYGATTGNAANAYMAVSDNALSTVPTFVSQVVNDPAKPLYPSGVTAGYIGLWIGGDLNEWIQVRFTPDGDLVAGLGADMCIELTSICRDGWDFQGTADKSRWQGVIGRLKL
jgi:hypothetical protein